MTISESSLMNSERAVQPCLTHATSAPLKWLGVLEPPSAMGLFQLQSTQMSPTCYPQWVVFVWVSPTESHFVWVFSAESYFCFKATHRKFQSYRVKSVELVLVVSSHIAWDCSPLVQWDCFSYNLLKWVQHVTHNGLFLFECHPQKVTLFECYPQKATFVSRLPSENLLPTSLAAKHIS